MTIKLDMRALAGRGLARLRAPGGKPSQSSVKVFTSIFDETKLLPHFLRHYDQCGASHFYIAAPRERQQDIERLASGYRVTVCCADVSDSYILGQATDAVHRIRESYQGEHEWALIADLDEFVVFDRSLAEIIASAEAEGANVVRGTLYDRFSASGETIDVAPDVDLGKQFPVRAKFTKDVLLGCDVKAVLVKGRLQGTPETGQHFLLAEKVASRTLEVDHYKWTGGVLDRLRDRCQALEALGIAWRVEHQRAIEHYEAHARFAWEHFGGELTSA
jgi:Glycosyl transferase family 2